MLSTSALISILVIFLVAVLCCYLVDMVGIGPPVNMVAKLIIVIIAILSLLKFIPGIL